MTSRLLVQATRAADIRHATKMQFMFIAGPRATDLITLYNGPSVQRLHTEVSLNEVAISTLSKADVHARELQAIQLALDHILAHGPDDVFRPPMFSSCLEVEVLRSRGPDFRESIKSQCIKFLRGGR